MAGIRTKLSTRRLTDEEKYQLIDKVLKRDKHRCVIHQTSQVEVHELLHRASGRKNSSTVFRLKYMVCVCPACHHKLHRTGEKRTVARQIFCILKDRFGYTYPAAVLKNFEETESLDYQIKRCRNER